MSARVPGVVTDPARPPAVIVAGGDAVVGHALELLLRGAGHSVRFVTVTHFRAPRSLEGARLLLLAPGLNARDRKAALARAAGGPDGTGIPVVELVPDTQASRSGDNHFLAPWPCRPQDLERQLEAALLANPRTDCPGGERPTHD